MLSAGDRLEDLSGRRGPGACADYYRAGAAQAWRIVGEQTCYCFPTFQPVARMVRPRLHPGACPIGDVSYVLRTVWTTGYAPDRLPLEER